MKVLWIIPKPKKCGIHIYSQQYINALTPHVEISVIDIQSWLGSFRNSVRTQKTFDILHLQYETSYFLHSMNHTFIHLGKQRIRPLVVSLHEIYPTFFGIFPRSKITGFMLTLWIKKLLYDKRHPYQTTFTHHLKNHFYAEALLVHGDYQKKILISKGIPSQKITVIPHPVQLQTKVHPRTKVSSHTYKMGSLGFITPHYDYALLFKVLQKLQKPWQFTWIGGIRQNKDTHLLQNIQNEIERRKWEKSFRITGWVTDKERNELLDQIDIYLALFLAKSSSGSLATAISAQKTIIATALPAIQELVRSNQILQTTVSNPEKIIGYIQMLYTNGRIRKTYQKELSAYIREHSFEKHSRKLITLYKGLIQ